MQIKEIMKAVETFAPMALAMTWDNVGLMVGQRDWEVSKAYVTLDVTPTAVEDAIDHGCQLILSHHPLIFKAQKSISDPLIIRLIQAQVAVISLHTNFDVAEDSVTHALARALGFTACARLSDESGAGYHHLVVYCPAGYEDKVCEAAWSAGAGKIGNYYNCATRHAVEGYFRAGEGYKPFTAMPEGSSVPETALEFMCDSFRLNSVLNAIKAAHPYETPALYHFPVSGANPAYGLGLVCQPQQELDLQQLARLVKGRLGCPHTKLWTAGKALNTPITRIAICGGSGGTLLGLASAKAEVFISGDISYHTFLDSRIPIIDAGHFYTEYPALQLLGSFVESLGLESRQMEPEKHEYSRFLEMV